MVSKGNTRGRQIAGRGPLTLNPLTICPELCLLHTVQRTAQLLAYSLLYEFHDRGGHLQKADLRDAAASVSRGPELVASNTDAAPPVSTLVTTESEKPCCGMVTPIRRVIGCRGAGSLPFLETIRGGAMLKWLK